MQEYDEAKGTNVPMLTSTPVDIPQPTGVFNQPWSFQKLIALMAVFGPAAIVASVSIGAGETIVVVRTGAWAGY